MIMIQKNPLIRLISDSKRHCRGMVWLLTLMFISGIIQSYAADFYGTMIDRGAASDFGQVVLFGFLTIIMYLADAIRLSLFNSESPRIVDMMFLDIRMDMFRAVAHSEMSAVEKTVKKGDILSRVTQDLSQLHRLFSERACWLISVVFRGLVALVFCLQISWKLALVYIILLPLVILLMDKLGKPLQSLQKQASQSGGNASSILSEIMANIQVVKSFGVQREMKRRFAACVDEQCSKLNESERRGMLLTLIGYTADILQLAIIFLLGVKLVFSSELSVGELVAFITLTGSIRQMFELAQTSVESLRKASALAARVYEVLDLPPETSAHRIVDSPNTNSNIDVSMRDLRFAYDENVPVLRGITLQLTHGKHIAFVGPSGCGKSTLTKLICQFYRNYDGELSLFGHSATDTSQDLVRNKIAIVSQQPYLFQGSVADNVRYGKLDATDAEVEQALRDVHLWDFVQTLDGGMHADIGDYGARLSGGQRQRVAIARALIKDAPLILLDEATSALDLHTEDEILSTLEGLFHDKTVITIAHRFAAVSSAAYVYCIEDGVVSEQGTLDQLLARDGYLSRIALAQEAR